MRVSHQLARLHGHDSVFSACSVVPSTLAGTGEPRQKARRKLVRGLMSNEQHTADAKRAFLLLRNGSLTLLDVSTHRALSISLVIRKSFVYS